jgi:hypothetical protein
MRLAGAGSTAVITTPWGRLRAGELRDILSSHVVTASTQELGIPLSTIDDTPSLTSRSAVPMSSTPAGLIKGKAGPAVGEDQERAAERLGSSLTRAAGDPPGPFSPCRSSGAVRLADGRTVPAIARATTIPANADSSLSTAGTASSAAGLTASRPRRHRLALARGGRVGPYRHGDHRGVGQ